MNRFFKNAIIAVVLSWLMRPASLWACAACYGASDSPMARGMNWGIFTLLAVVLCVLGTFATFIVFLAKRSAAISVEALVKSSAEPVEKI